MNVSTRAMVVAAFGALLGGLVPSTQAAVNIANMPLSVTPNVTPNILLILDNSNSMVEDVSGAVAAECDPGPGANCVAGAASPRSKSEIIRGVGRRLLDEYLGRINLGLMAYQQGSIGNVAADNSNVNRLWVGDRIYDVSYNSSDYTPSFSGYPWDDNRKRQRVPNPRSAGDHIHFNVRVPGYSPGEITTSFYTARESGGGWTSAPFLFNCYANKSGTDNRIPSNFGGGGSAQYGYSNSCGTTSGNLNDSARARGVTNWGQRMVWLPYNQQEWFAANSPGLGYLHQPIRELDGTHAAAIRTKLGTQPTSVTSNLLTHRNDPLVAAGLTPLEGTLYTTRDYFLNQTAHFGNAQGRGNAQHPLPESCDINTAIWLTDGMPSVNRQGTPLGANTQQALQEAVAAASALHQEAGVDLYVVGFAMPPTVSEDQLEQLAHAGGTARAYLASDEGSLDDTMTRVFDNIIASPRESGTSSVINTLRLGGGTQLYTAGFRSEDWSGRLEAFRLDGNLNRSVVWNAERRLAEQPSRRIYTPSGPLASASTALSAEQVAWLFGEDGSLRQRRSPSGERRLLGDIVNANPVLRPAVSGSAQPDVLFVAANDGMLHAFDSRDGAELFAYIPSELVQGDAPLTELMEPDYSHRYFMDGTPTVRNVGSADAPRQVLVGSMGAGGRTVFALDVTSPQDFGSADVLWEFQHPSLGEGVSDPVIARLGDGTWAVIFGNGYNSSGQRASLFVVDLLTGNLIRHLEVGQGGGSNGLAAPATTQWPDFNGRARFAYAGDLLGNMWRFDLVSGDTQSLLAGRASQPITSAPALALKPGDADTLMVMFGTGSYFQVNDATSSDAQRLYGIQDTLGGSRGNDFQEQTIGNITTLIQQGDESIEYHLRTVTNHALEARHRGWYLSLSGGERVISTPALAQGFGQNRVRFSSMRPLDDPCQGGVEGFLMDVSIDTGGSGTQPIFDLDRDGVVDERDLVNDEVIAGLRFGSGETVASVNNPGAGLDYLFVGDPDDTTSTPDGSGYVAVGSAGEASAGRQSWRQLR